MGTAAATSISERLQALQQLESAFGQPSGGLFFTYNGGLYQSIGVNADDTLRALNVNTGQIAASLDPVDIYSAAMASAGTPLPPPPAPAIQPVQGPSIFTTVTGQVGTYTGFLNMGMQIPKVSGYLKVLPGIGHLLGPVLGSVGAFLSSVSVFQGVQGMFKNGVSFQGMLGIGMNSLGIATGINMLAGLGVGLHVLTNPAGWAVAAAVLSASVLYGSINSMVRNGASVKGVALAASSFVGTALFTNIALHMLHLFGVSSMFGPIGFAVAIAIAVFSLLWSLFHKPPVEQVAAQNLSGALNPVIWTPGPLTLVGVGTVALLMGWGSSKMPPAMASLTVPAYYLNQVMASNGLANVPSNSQTPSVLVEPGDGKVVIVSPSGTDSNGNALVTLQSYNVAKTFQFVSSPQAPPQGSYIPFFQVVNGKLSKTPSPQVVNALNIQDKMLQAVLSGALNSKDAMNALNVAAAANKTGVNPAY